ncbi:sigma-70 family RNA polymerase sigma factor [Streptomyces sp. SID13031]|uniref:RNA polymerase sigma factor n=1 Tax=Streptomyces sp. SID13031 TaxID=2706046 RepID=UPI0013CCFEAE|nr:sigma-70 family RNA polymerase sigma factor [Streptomyces sp. SID13031]NEA30650.1 sigma-70 family RNA polymerase sigma factor [Streptomyces sp. SID13031]
MRDDPAVIRLVEGARSGDKGAWDELVERYAPLVWSVSRRFRLSAEDVADVGQTVWLRLIERLPELREPAALPGWIVTTTQHECLRLVRIGRRTEATDPAEVSPDLSDQARAVDEELLADERRETVRAAFVQLAPRCQSLLSMLVSDPPAAYSEISQKLHMPIGSIGPNRARCLERLRSAPALASLIAEPKLRSRNSKAVKAKGGEQHDRPVVER